MCVLANIAFRRLSESVLFSSIVLVGMTVAVLLLASSAWHLIRPIVNRRSLTHVAFLVVVAIVLTLASVSPVVVLLACGAAGAIWARSQ
jgi:chromate transport protein ChrA